MKAIVKVSIDGIFKGKSFTATTTIDFEDNSNVFERICKVHNFFADAYNVNFNDVNIISCKYIKEV